MGRGLNSKKGTGKRFWISVSCLLLLTGIIGIMAFSVAKALCGRTEFDNSIDAEYMPLINKSSGEGKIALLKEYEMAWRRKLEDYLKDYRAVCNDQSNKEMVDEYLDAIYEAVDAQKELMEYMNVSEEEQHWYSARIYYCSYMKDIRGKFDGYEANIDEEHKTGAVSGQEAFNIEWSNKLALLTMDFYEILDEEGKQLANKWQESREQWKAASNSSWKKETDIEIMEVNGWINQLYYQQLESMVNGF